MEDNNVIEYPQIRYHITYDENLTFKDVEELLKLIRLSNNDILEEEGISRAKGNDIQQIECVEPGSINLLAILKEILSIPVSVFAERTIDKIINRINAAIEYSRTHPKADKQVYCKHEVKVKIGEQTISIESNIPTINIIIDVRNDDKFNVSINNK